MLDAEARLRALVLTAAMSCAGCAPWTQPSSRPVDGQADAREMAGATALEDAADRITWQSNTLRASSGLGPLVTSRALGRTAADFAAFMAASGRYGHSADGQTSLDRAKAHDYEACILGENIGYRGGDAGPSSAQVADDLFQGWRSSEPHRANMLDPDVTDIGVGLAFSPRDNRVYAVQLFGRPRSSATAFHIRNSARLPLHYRVAEKTYTLPPGYRRTHRICRPAELRVEAPQALASITPQKNEALEARVSESGQLELRRSR